MSGKAILFLVIGFSIIFLIMEKNIGTASNRSVDTMASYYNNMNVHNIAVSGANVAANQIFLDPTWVAGYSNIPFAGGTYGVTVDILNAFKNIRRITSIGYYAGYIDTVQVTLQPSSFSKYAYYSVNEGSNIFWVTGDTVWGPLHTQDLLRINGDPVFNGKVTTKDGMVVTGYSDPQFNAGYQAGVDVPIPGTGISDLQTLADNGGKDFTGQDTVYLKFAGDNIQYKYSYSSSYTTVAASTLAPNGVIFGTGAVLRVQGTVKGQYTIGSSQITTTSTTGKGKKKKTTTTTTGGDIYLDGDVVYNTDPVANPKSTDLLGIVAQNNVLISDNSVNNNNIKIQASIYAQTGGFGSENYDTRPAAGTIYLYGGITQNTRLPVGTFNNSGSKNVIVSGFQKSYMYDNRLMVGSPPGFPNTGQFEIVSWYE
jgi:hypothetical protein